MREKKRIPKSSRRVDLGLGIYNPLWTSGAAQKRIIDAFLDAGCSSHSKSRSYIGYIIKYCEDNGIEYTLKAAPGKGFYIERMIDEG